MLLALGLAGWGGVAWAQPLLQLRATPLLSEALPRQGSSATFVSGDQLLGRDGLETTLQGAAELRRPGLVVRAERMHYDHTTDTLSVQGQGHVNARGDRYSAPEGQLQPGAMRGFLLQPSYHLLNNGAHGQAERIEFLDAERITAERGHYTTCPRPDGRPDWVPDWLLRADRLDIDREEELGLAEGGVLEFKGLPLVPVPAMRFPMGAQRLSGWLPPTIGIDSKSGMELTLPWYWNIAPQRDATFTPTLMARRGVDLGGEFRYLEDNYQGRANLNLMPHDRLRGRSRWGLHARHDGRYDSGLAALGDFGLGLNLNRVSDHDYWRDFTRRSDPALTSRLLPSEGHLNWARGDLALTLRAQKWQVLQDVAAPIVPPYDRLPQLNARWARSHPGSGIEQSVEAEFTRFHADRFWTGQPNAQRSLIHAQLARPMQRSWGFFTPRLQLHATHYDFDAALADGRRSHSRVLPTFSLDSGLVFERSASYFGRSFTQTLEPRLKYVHTPWRDQNLLPNYDSGAYDFNFTTIWSENAFAGHDRIVDNNLITAGLTSRLIDPQTGNEALRLAVAQRYRFKPQRVTLPGGQSMDSGVSDIMLGAAINWDPRWSFDTVLQYNPDTNRSTRTTVHGRYSPGPYRNLSAAYRQQRDLGSEHLDLAWQWPLAALTGQRGELGTSGSGAGGSCRGRWYSVGRLNYSLRDSRLVDSILGLEYDAGCWIGRVVFEKLQSSVTSSTKRIMFQLEFVGLSRLGTSSLQSLQEHIPRYQMLRHDQPTPSRFTDYE